jgi:hypothetical protein
MVHSLVAVTAGVITAGNCITQKAIRSNSIRTISVASNATMLLWIIGFATVSQFAVQNGKGKSTQAPQPTCSWLAKLVAPLRRSIYCIFAISIVSIQLNVFYT